MSSASAAASLPVLPGSLNTNRRLSQWLSIHSDGKVTVRSGKVELGQGILTALQLLLAQINLAFRRGGRCCTRGLDALRATIS